MTGGIGISSVRMDTGLHQGHTAGYRRRGTGLGVEGEINGRPATDDERAAQESAWARSREATAAQLTIAPWSGAQ